VTNKDRTAMEEFHEGDKLKITAYYISVGSAARTGVMPAVMPSNLFWNKLFLFLSTHFFSLGVRKLPITLQK